MRVHLHTFPVDTCQEFFFVFLAVPGLAHITGSTKDPRHAAITDILSFIKPIENNYNIRNGFDHQIHARQLDSCLNSCAWVEETLSCGNNLTCDCLIISKAGAAGVSACANCIQPFNATLASQTLTIGEYCGIQASITVPGYQPTATSSVNGYPTISVVSSTSTSSTSSIMATSSRISSPNSPPTSSTTFKDPQTSTTSTSPPSSGGSQLSGGAIGGIVGGIVGVFVIAAAVVFLLVRRKPRKRPETTMIVPTPIPHEAKMQETTTLAPASTEIGAGSGRLRYPDPADEDTAQVGGRTSRVY